MTLGNTFLRLNLLAVAFCACVPLCPAQTIPAATFRYTSSDSPTPVLLPGNVAVEFPAVSPPGSSSVTLFMEYTGSSRLTVSKLVVDGPGFAVPAFSPIVLDAGASTTFILVFTALAGGPALGSLEIEATLGVNTYRQSFILRANSTAPRFVLSYLLGAGSNQLPVSGGQSITLPSAVVGQSVSATVIVGNAGTAAGLLNAVSIGSGPFATAGLPLLPARIPPNGEVRFSVSFAPAARGTFTTSLSVEVPGTVYRIGLVGQGLAPSLRYDYQTGDSSLAVTSGTQLDLGSAALGGFCSGTLKVTNTGDADARTTSIALTGAGFRITDQPALPATLAPQQTFSIGVAFSPSTGGVARGQLRIDSATFALNAIGTAAQLTFTAITAEASVLVAGNGVIAFPEASVGSRTSVLVRIANAGTAAGTVASIAVKGSGFSAPSYPPLPATLAPAGTIAFTLVFAPESIGPVSGSLEIDQTTFVLRGIAAAPPALPAVLFADLPATAEPLLQPAASLRLAQPYPMDLKGTMLLKFTPDSINDDPSVQFAGGGRSVAFTIPANSTEALFGPAETKIRFQTGSVAGVIALTATFGIGQLDVTPAAIPIKTITLPPAPPRLRGVQIGSRTSSGFEILISGYSNTRSLSGLRLEFQAAQGVTLQNPVIDVATETSFSAWFQSSASRDYGSQFTASVFVTVNGKLEDIQSVSVRASCPQGPSETLSAALR